MMPEPTMYARRTSILIFHDQGSDKGVQRLSGSYYGARNWYEGTWADKTKKQFESLAGVIKNLNPKKIGINTSEHWAFGDGLSASLKDKLEKALGPELSSRFVSAENLCIGWLETRSPQELSVYRHIAGIAHDIIAEFYSSKVITPGITSTEDVVWWIRQKVTDLGLEAWFQPSISIQRSKNDADRYKENPRIIQRGDVLHCDVGIVYLGLCTDMQLQAYVCRIGEDDAPEGLKEALRRTIEVGTTLRNEFKAEGPGMRSFNQRWTSLRLKGCGLSSTLILLVFMAMGQGLPWMPDLQRMFLKGTRPGENILSIPTRVMLSNTAVQRVSLNGMDKMSVLDLRKREFIQKTGANLSTDLNKNIFL
ncbi:M24 family metallopeptidase [Acidobacteriota bacterium]